MQRRRPLSSPCRPGHPLPTASSGPASSHLPCLRLQGCMARPFRGRLCLRASSPCTLPGALALLCGACRSHRRISATPRELRERPLPLWIWTAAAAMPRLLRCTGPALATPPPSMMRSLRRGRRQPRCSMRMAWPHRQTAGRLQRTEGLPLPSAPSSGPRRQLQSIIGASLLPATASLPMPQLQRHQQ